MIVVPVRQRAPRVGAAAVTLHFFLQGSEVIAHPLRILQQSVVAKLPGEGTQRTPGVRRDKVEQIPNRGSKSSNAKLGIQKDYTNAGAAQQAREIARGDFELVKLHLQPGVDGGVFFVERLQLFINAHRFLV